MISDPIIERHHGFQIVRDDLLPGGTKRRAVHAFFQPDVEEYVYCSPVYGFAQLALAYAARDYGKRATIFCAKRKERHCLTLEAAGAGARIVEIDNGYMSVLRARAKSYADDTFRCRVLPFGLNDPVFHAALVRMASTLAIDQPREVWTVLGSGVLSRALQQAWPEAKFYGVRVGAECEPGRAEVFDAPERYEQAARFPPPFPSNTNYDAKVWQFMLRHASPGALFWNVGS